MKEVWVAFGLTLFAGMATAIGSVIAFTAKRTNYRFLSVATGFSAGVMLYVSFVEIFLKGVDSLVPRFGETGAHWVNTASFFGGMLLIGLIDNLIPAAENPHEVHSEAEMLPLHAPLSPAPDFEALSESDVKSPDAHDHQSKHKLMRMGLFTALAVGIHNFRKGWPPFSRRFRIRASESPSPSPSRYTIYLKASVFPSPSSTPPEAGKRHSSTQH